MLVNTAINFDSTTFIIVHHKYSNRKKSLCSNFVSFDIYI